MRMRRRLVVLCAVVCVCVIAVGCGLFEPKTPPPWEGCPDWVSKDLAAIYPDDGTENLYARGMSDKGVTDEITRERAMNNARAAMALELQAHVEKLMKDWMTMSQNLIDPGSDVGKRYTEIVSRQFTEADLRGCGEVTWATNPVTGAMHSLMRMPIKGNGELRAEIRKEAEKELRQGESKVKIGEVGKAVVDLDAYLSKQFDKP